VVLLLLYWRRSGVPFTDGFNKASDKPNELNDINGVYEANFILYASLSNCKGTANI
jgi:hypothetical protein